MTWFRIFYAVFFAWGVWFEFNQSWKWEHAKPLDNGRGKETVVISGLAFLFAMMFYLILLMFMMGVEQGFSHFLGAFLDIVVTFSVYYALLLVALPILRRYFSAKACATLWLLPALIFAQPTMIFITGNIPKLIINIPPIALRWSTYIWITGFIVTFAGYVISHIIFRNKLMSDAKTVEDPETLRIWQEVLHRADYKKTVKLLYSKNTNIPLSMGLTNKTRITLLPKSIFSEEQLHFIFRHEIVHLQRSDVDIKVFLAFCRALCWFNPLVWVAIRKASDDLELSCDERVLEDSNNEERRRYAELLLQTAGHTRGFTTCLSSAAESLRYRLKYAVTLGKRRVGAFLLASAMFCCVMSYGVLAVSSERGTIREILFSSDMTSAGIENVSHISNDNVKDEGPVYALKWDQEKLFSYITNLKIEKLNSANQLNPESVPNIRFHAKTSKGGALFIISDHMIKVKDLQSIYAEYYLVRSDIDWDYILLCLEF